MVQKKKKKTQPYTANKCASTTWHSVRPLFSMEGGAGLSRAADRARAACTCPDFPN